MTRLKKFFSENRCAKLAETAAKVLSHSTLAAATVTAAVVMVGSVPDAGADAKQDLSSIGESVIQYVDHSIAYLSSEKWQGLREILDQCEVASAGVDKKIAEFQKLDALNNSPVFNALVYQLEEVRDASIRAAHNLDTAIGNYYADLSSEEMDYMSSDLEKLRDCTVQIEGDVVEMHALLSKGTSGKVQTFKM